MCNAFAVCGCVSLVSFHGKLKLMFLESTDQNETEPATLTKKKSVKNVLMCHQWLMEKLMINFVFFKWFETFVLLAL